jgi:hypothetical protein
MIYNKDINKKGQAMNNNQIKEATKRNQLLNITNQDLTQFTNEEVVNALNNLQERCGALPYHIIKTEGQFDTEYSILFVSDREEDWSKSQEDIKNGKVLAYIYNTSYAQARFDYIGIESVNGELKRTW